MAAYEPFAGHTYPVVGADYVEVPITIGHALDVERMPALHRAPFDRILLSQAITEQCTLLTADANIAWNQGPIIYVFRPGKSHHTSKATQLNAK